MKPCRARLPRKRIISDSRLTSCKRRIHLSPSRLRDYSKAAAATGNVDFAAELLHTTQQGQQELESKRWKISTGSREMVLREHYDHAPTWSGKSFDCKVPYQKCMFNKNEDTVITRLTGNQARCASRGGTDHVVLRLHGSVSRISLTRWLPPAIGEYHTSGIKTTDGETQRLRLSGVPILNDPTGKSFPMRHRVLSRWRSFSVFRSSTGEVKWSEVRI
jgi:hypothetical protein